MAILQAKEVVKTYIQGKVEVNALAGISLEVEKGEFTALGGPSGSGKTTLLNLLGGLDKPTSGHVFLDDKELTSLSQKDLATLRLHKIGFVFQAYNLIPVLSAQENVEYIMMLQGIDKKKRAEHAQALLDEVGLQNMYHRRPAELSGGQQQRVAVARAIVSKPDIVLADEPTANLDSKTSEKLLELMLEMNTKHQITFLFSTHDQMVMDYTRRIIHIKDGKLKHDEKKQPLS